MDAIAEKLEMKLHEREPETAQQVRELVTEIIQLADCDALDIGRSRASEQEVLDVLDAPLSLPMSKGGKLKPVRAANNGSRV